METLKKNAEMLTVLHEMGIPVAEIIPVPSGDPYACCDERYYMLSKKLPGNNETDIKQEGIAEKMGEILGRLHLAFRKCEERLELWDKNGWMKKPSAELSAICRMDMTGFRAS